MPVIAEVEIGGIQRLSVDFKKCPYFLSMLFYDLNAPCRMYRMATFCCTVFPLFGPMFVRTRYKRDHIFRDQHGVSCGLQCLTDHKYDV